MLKFDENKLRESINGALRLRNKINDIVDKYHRDGYTNICFIGIGGTWASSLQAQIHMKEYSVIEVIVENAKDYILTGNKRITKDSIVIFSSVSGTTKEIVEAMQIIKNIGSKVISFVDTVDSKLYNMFDNSISYQANEQLKFFMVADRFMYLNNEFDIYDQLYENLDDNLANALIDVEKKSDEFAKEFAKKHCNDQIHYFVGSGNQWGATYSYAMCYWEEQLWIKTKSISSPEFFHGMFEIVTKDTPVTVFLGEDSQRDSSLRVKNFLPKICANYTFIDTMDYELCGIKRSLDLIYHIWLCML